MASSSWRAAAHDLARLIQIPAGLAVLPLLVAAIRHEWVAAVALACMTLGALVAGALLTRLPSAEGDALGARRTTAMAWLVLGAECALPFLIWGVLAEGAEAAVLARWSNALFEGVSGITSTGLTVLDRPQTLPHSLQLWRTLLEWLGGVGVVVLVLAFGQVFSSPAKALYAAEARRRSFAPSLTVTVRRIWFLYVTLSLLAISSLWLVGLPFWIALNHGLTGISTGGFTVTQRSFASAGAAAQITALVIMLVGATSFALLHAVIVRHRLRALTRCLQLPVFVGGLLGGAWLLATLAPELTPLEAVFQWCSALATCGFSVSESAQLPTPALFALLLAMLLGGMAGSTAGGLKIERLLVLLQAALSRLRGRPSLRLRVDEGTVEGEAARERRQQALRFLTLLAVSWAAGSLVLVLLGGGERPLVHCLFEAASALGCVGLSAGVTSAELDLGSQLVLMLLMWVGRLEVVAVLSLVLSPLGRHDSV